MNQAITLTHLQRLEAESIHIMREVVAESEKPVMLYSVGKDSAVMLHLARKAFYPGAAAIPACCTSIRLGSSAPCTSCATAWRKESGMELHRLSESGGEGARHQSRSITARRCTRTCGRPRD